MYKKFRFGAISTKSVSDSALLCVEWHTFVQSVPKLEFLLTDEDVWYDQRVLFHLTVDMLTHNGT